MRPHEHQHPPYHQTPHRARSQPQPPAGDDTRAGGSTTSTFRLRGRNRPGRTRPRNHRANPEPAVDPAMVALARQFNRGEEAAVRELHRRYAGRILASVLPVVGGDRRLAEDVVQETFLRAWRRAHTLDPERPIEPWLFRIARNTAIDTLRSAQRRPVTAALSDPERLRDPRDDTDPERATGLMALRWAVRAALDHLPEGERDVVRLQHLHGLRHVEIADRLGISVGTVKSRSHRAHRRLAELLRAYRPSSVDPSAPTSARNRSTTPRRPGQAGSSACRM